MLVEKVAKGIPNCLARAENMLGMVRSFFDYFFFIFIFSIFLFFNFLIFLE
jgi:hypothetical protein